MLQFLLLVIPLCSGTLLPSPSGPYQLTLNVSQLIDTSRKDPWGMDPTAYRRLMISRFDLLPQTLVTETRKCLACHRPSHQLRMHSLLLTEYQLASLHLSKWSFAPNRILENRVKHGRLSFSLRALTPLVSCTPCWHKKLPVRALLS